MTIHPDDVSLQIWFDHALPEPEQTVVGAHLAICGRCTAKVDGLRSLRAAFQQWDETTASTSGDLTNAIFATIVRASRRL